MKSQRGFSLVEMSIVIAAALVIMAATLMYWSRVEAGRKSAQLVTMVSAIDKAVRTRYGDAWNYTGLTAATLTDFLPGDMRPAACTGFCIPQIVTPFGGGITVAPWFPGGSFAITISAPLPTEACVDLVTKLGTQYWYIQRGSLMKAKSFAAVDSATATAACGSTSTAALRLTGV